MSPFKPLHPCNRSGCPRLTATRFCPEHTKKEKEKYERNRGSAGERGYDANWHKLSKLHLDEFPLCQDCERQGKVKAAILTHHIKPVETHPELRLVWENLESVCEECHNTTHKENRWRK